MHTTTLTDAPQATPRPPALPSLDEALQGAAALIAAGRLAIGGVAVLRPEFMVGTWLGSRHDTGPAGRVLGRALGGRDIALAVGALSKRADPAEFRRWVLLGALADTADAVATLANWRSLPKLSRLAVLLAAGGAAVVGAVSASRQPAE